MKKKLCLLLGILAVFVCLLMPAGAKSNEILDMSIQVKIDENGNAYIEEKWKMDVYDGTEVYKVYENMAESKIKDLKVKDDQGHVYKNIGEWDVDASREDKLNKCGLVQEDDHYEICFGMGDYGQRTYTFSYTVTHFIKQYNDDQGISFAFFSELVPEPKHVRIIVSSPYEFDEDNSQIWGFGYAGNVKYEDGKVVMETTTQVPRYKMMQLLMRIDDGTFNKAYPQDKDFEDVYELAVKNSEYEEDDEINPLVITAVVVGITALAIFVVGLLTKKYGKKLCFRDGISLRKEKDIDIYSSIPECHDLFEFYYLAQKAGVIGEEMTGLLSAILLKWSQSGFVSFKGDEDDGAMHFHDLHNIEHPLELKLLELMKDAAKSHSQLKMSQFEDWYIDHYEDIQEWEESIEDYVEDNYRQDGLLMTQDVYTRYMGIKIKKTIDVFDVSLRKTMEEIIGFKKYLEEITILDSDNLKNLKDYVIFAELLDVSEEFEERLQDSLVNLRQPMYANMFYMSHMSHAFVNNGIESSVSSGIGGNASFTGGGGFSGGGGGGTR